TGKGTVSSSPAGITCGSACSASYASGAAVTLTATPAYGSAFDGWSGACSGTGTCTVVGNAPTSAVATFSATPTVTVSITSPAPLSTVSGKIQVTASALAAAGIANVQ